MITKFRAQLYTEEDYVRFFSEDEAILDLHLPNRERGDRNAANEAFQRIGLHRTRWIPREWGWEITVWWPQPKKL